MDVYLSFCSAVNHQPQFVSLSSNQENHFDTLLQAAGQNEEKIISLLGIDFGVIKDLKKYNASYSVLKMHLSAKTSKRANRMSFRRKKNSFSSNANGAEAATAQKLFTQNCIKEHQSSALWSRSQTLTSQNKRGPLPLIPRSPLPLRLIQACTRSKAINAFTREEVSC